MPLPGNFFFSSLASILIGSNGLFSLGVPPSVAPQMITPSTLKQLPTIKKSLPATPLYQSAAVTKDIHTLLHSRQSKHVQLIIDSSSRLKALAHYAKAVNTPGNPYYHHFLTPHHLNHQFGPSAHALRRAKVALSRAGWTFTGAHGMTIDATIPKTALSHGIPVSSHIWSITGIQPVTIHSNSTSPNSTSAGGYSFSQAPIWSTQVTSSAGDTVSAMSFNSQFSAQLAAGLPFNLILSAHTASGAPTTISQISQVKTSTSLDYMPTPQPISSSQEGLYRMKVAVAAPVSAPSSLSFTATLGDGSQVTVTVPLPVFNGQSSLLNHPLTSPSLIRLGHAHTIAASPVSQRSPVALFTLGQAPSMSDLSTLMHHEGVTMPSVNFFYEDGATTTMTAPAGTGEFTESTLDLQSVASVDPGGTINEYVYPSSSTSDPLTAFLSTLSQQSQAKIASISYAFSGEDPATVASLLNALTAEGITVFMSSGDTGSVNLATQLTGVNSTISQPDLTSVGGMAFAASTSSGFVTNHVIAKAWGGAFIHALSPGRQTNFLLTKQASSGGYGSTSVPSWQTGFVPSTAPGIGVPDIASLAGSPYLAIVQNGTTTQAGGTSVASPLSAGFLADLEGSLNVGTQGLGNINPTVFAAANRAPSDFTQAQSGSNGAYSVSSAPWNPVTGLGQPRWDALTSAFSTTPTTPDAFHIALPTSVIAGVPTSVTITAMNGSTALTHFSGTVSLSSSDAQASYPHQVTLSNGQAHLSMVFKHSGNQSLTVSDLQRSPVVTSTQQTHVSNPLSLTVSPSTTTVANHETIAVSDTALSNPVYQYWIQNPVTHVWHNSGAFTSTNHYAYRSSVPGRYPIVVYAKNAGQSQIVNTKTSHLTFTSQSGHPMVSSLHVSAPSVSQSPGRNVTFSAKASDSGGTALYQFWVHGPDNQWKVVQNYSTTATYTLHDVAPGSYDVAVFALDSQQLRRHSWSHAYYYSTVINVGSSVALSGPTTASVGQKISYLAQATAITQPIYQFWVKTPSGNWHQWPYGSGTFQYTPKSSGTYSVVVFAKDPYALQQSAFEVQARHTLTVP